MTDRTDRHVLDLREVDRSHLALVGGKGAHLGELSRIEGVRVPDGFCVTTDAFRRSLAGAPSIGGLIDRLARAPAEDRDAIRAIGAELRRAIEGVAIPEDLAESVTAALARLGERAGWAVRSSATAEDLPGASFAGQHDTYLNVVGADAVLRRIRRCWASLFTERAVTYRARSGFDHREVRMAVVVQRMVVPHAAGVLFTADPLTSNRKTSSIEAVPGLGEALVSGQVNPDVLAVRDGQVVARKVAAGPQQRAALTDAQAVRLAELGRRIEAHFACPQDIEWCLVDDAFAFVQSRPITTLFPIPAADDDENHVYISVGHQQMMTDPLRPLGLSLFQLISAAPMREAGGRLFVDVTRRLASPASRASLLEAMERHDPLMSDALRSLLERGDFLPSLPDPAPAGPPPAPASIETDPAVVVELMERCQASIAALERDIRSKSGPALLDFILADIQELRRILFDPRSHQVFMSAIEASWWLSEHLHEWLGERNAADILTQSVPHNVTSEMGMALLDVADAIRPHPAVVAFLRRAQGDDFLDALPELEGGREARDAITAFLGQYGMRCPGEIDITRPRWSDRPAALLPMILANVENAAPGAGKRRFEQGQEEARQKEREVLERLRALPDGARRAEETKQRIDRVRTFIGYREFPKYGMVSRTFVYRRTLLDEARRLLRAGVIRDQEDIFYLTFQELHDAVRTGQVDHELVRRRAEAFRWHQTLTPPRVLTSDGEIVAGAYHRDVPAGALVGLAVSAGTVEGRARIVLDLARANLEPGDILVTAYTDPSWTAVFVGIAGLVTEAGGLMTHGAVIAREYGLPAVVGVERATRLIRDGQRIRVHGTEGHVELLPDDVTP